MSYIYMEHPFLTFLDHTQRRSTVGRIPLDEWSARRRDLYLTTHDTHNRETSMAPVGFELTISAGERPQTYALDRAVAGTGVQTYKDWNIELWPPHSWGFLDHTQWRTTVGRTPLEEWSARRRDLYLTTHNTHNRETSMPPVGFELTISAGERPQTYALDRTATATGK